MKQFAHLSLACVLLLLIQTASAAVGASFSQWPETFKVPFGTNNKPVKLQYKISLSGSQSVRLSNPTFTFQKRATNASGNIQNINISFSNGINCNTNGAIATLSPAAEGAYCLIDVSLTATGKQAGGGDISTESYQAVVTAQLANQPAQTLSSELVNIQFATGKQVAARTITVRNQCPYNVSLGIHGTITQSIHSNGNNCQSNNDCAPGSSCSNGQCYWKNPIPPNGYQLASGGATTLTIPIFDTGLGFNDRDGHYVPKQIAWSGGIAGQYGCTNEGCVIADCGGNGGACAPAQTFKQPFTAAEFTLFHELLTVDSSSDANYAPTYPLDDIYDVTLINGITIPVSMAPNNARWAGMSDPFNCGGAGSANTQNSPAACSWQFMPPSNDYRFVAYNPNVTETCNTDADCATNAFKNKYGTGSICGLTKAPGSTNLQKKCGLPYPHNPIGGAYPSTFYWNGNSVCQLTKNQYNAAPFSCNSPVPTAGGTYSDLYACTGTFSASCYTGSKDIKPSFNCCGCTNWGGIFSSSAFKSARDICYHPNTDWVNYAIKQNNLAWIKRGCPTAYVYPYDDKTSTFYCKALDFNKKNTVNYTVTFCPG